MRSRRKRRYRKVEVLDNKVNLINLKVDKWIDFYDRDTNSVAKLIIASMAIGTAALIVSIILFLKGVI